MLNDRDEKYEAPEESEYHFSEDDVSYEVEPETPKPPVPEAKENILNRLTRSKRMILSLVVFLVLVFAVYKMLAPTTTPSIADNIQPVPPVLKSSSPQAVEPVTYTQSATASQQPEPPPVMSAPPSLPQNAAQIATMPATTQLAPTGSQQPYQSMPQQGPAQSYQQPQPLPIAGSQASVVQAAAPPTTGMQAAQPMMMQPPPAMVAQSPAPTMTAPSYGAPTAMPQQAISQYNTQPITPSTLSTQVPGGMDAGAAAAAVSANSQQLMAQWQAEYAQRMNEYASQNKNLSDQVEALSNKVAAVEAEMRKLLQVLTRQEVVRQAPPPPPRVSAEPRVQVNEPRIAYNVQAIIPGRAWLRSDSGETVTVAEGDTIKSVGRVVKIDPYDGVVEINTGNKVVSLSYGNGA